MEGVQAYNCKAFHPTCGVAIEVVDIGGFAFLWCIDCRVFCRLESVSPKYATFEAACEGIALKAVPT